jgi:hypothetical protein
MATAATPRRIEIEWAANWQGKQPALEFFDKVAEEERKELRNAIRHLEEGSSATINYQKFKRLNNELFELKGHQSRLIGSFRPGGRFVIAHGVLKKQDEHRESDLLVAKNIMKQYDATARNSAPFVGKLSPKLNPEHKAKILSLVRPPVHAPTTIETKEFQIRETCDYAWAYVKTSDLLPPDCPLMQSMARLPHLHNVVLQDELKPFLEARLKGLPMETRIALGMVDDNITHLHLGALWAVELIMSRVMVEPLPEVVEATPPVEEIPIAAAEPAPQEYRLYWVRYGQKRLLTWVCGDVKSRRSKNGDAVPKVRTRTYIRSRKSWGNAKIARTQLFKDLASLKDPIVQEAISRCRTLSSPA